MEGDIRMLMRVQWRPPGDVPEPIAPPEWLPAPAEQPDREPIEIPKPPPEPREKPAPEVRGVMHGAWPVRPVCGRI